MGNRGVIPIPERLGDMERIIYYYGTYMHGVNRLKVKPAAPNPSPYHHGDLKLLNSLLQPKFKGANPIAIVTRTSRRSFPRPAYR